MLYILLVAGNFYSQPSDFCSVLFLRSVSSSQLGLSVESYLESFGKSCPGEAEVKNVCDSGRLISGLTETRLSIISLLVYARRQRMMIPERGC